MAALAVAPLVAQSQSTELHIRFNSGQAVVPIYEGWERVSDGSFNMVFGYLNRNHVEELAVPVGAQNGFEPGPADRGQPTYFYPRENHFLFKVNVPKDWDRKKELVWTVTANGKTEVTRATLLDIWESDRKVEVSNNGGVQISNELINKDVPPVVKIDPIARLHAGTPVTITASVTDDGIPTLDGKPRPWERIEPSLTGAPVRYEPELYGASAATLRERVRGMPDDVGSVLLVGHNPAIELLAADLACPSPLRDDLEAKFPTGALATLAVPSASWRGLGDECAELVAFVRPRDLAR